MFRRYRVGLLAALLASIITGRTWADDKSPPTKTYAVVVGVSEFEDTKIKPRPTAVPDANALYDVLTDKTVGGIPADDVRSDANVGCRFALVPPAISPGTIGNELGDVEEAAEPEREHLESAIEIALHERPAELCFRRFAERCPATPLDLH